MTTTTHRKSIVAVIVAGALAIAAPAGASVLEPVSAGWNPGGADVQTINATAQPSSESSAPGYQTVNATYHPADQQPTGYQTVNAAYHPAEQPPIETTAAFVPIRGVPSGQVPGAERAADGGGLDLGQVAIGAGGVVLLLSIAMLGSSAINGRRESGTKSGTAVPRTV
jgi:hypothetical protein